MKRNSHHCDRESKHRERDTEVYTESVIAVENMAGKTVMQELLCREYYVEAAKQELLCRDYDVEAAMERAFPGMGDVFYHGSFCAQTFMMIAF